MTSSNETLKHIIRDYNPQKQEMLCKIDLIKLSQMEALRNPTPDKKDVYEAFFEYAGKLKESHPDWDSESYIKERFGKAYDKMGEIAPKAKEKYEALEQNKKKVMSLSPEQKKGIELIEGKRQRMI